MKDAQELAAEFINSLTLENNRPGGTAWIKDRGIATKRLANLIHASQSVSPTMKFCWHPISEMRDRHEGDFLLRAPELYCGDSNENGVAPGYWQDSCEDDHPEGGDWMCPRWVMDFDHYENIIVNPTHFMIIEGPAPFTDAEMEAAHADHHERYIRRMSRMQAPSMGLTEQEVYDGHIARRERYSFDAKAEEIYNSWSDQPGWTAWIPFGNSDKQNEARTIARSAAYADEAD